VTCDSCLEHENVIRLYGICYNPLGMVMEFAGNGDLHDLLESLQKGKVNKDPYSLRTSLSLSARVRACVRSF
jgi:serine/threonine protein kinase